MDHIVHQHLTRLNMFLMQELDFQVDVLRFATEPEYAAQVLDLALETDHGELCQLSRQIRERQLQLFSLNASQAAADNDPDATLVNAPAVKPGLKPLPKSS
ncbi:MAG: hypothetical protein QM776_01460 [Rhodocyclaceae bacterium]